MGRKRPKNDKWQREKKIKKTKERERGFDGEIKTSSHRGTPKAMPKGDRY